MWLAPPSRYTLACVAWSLLNVVTLSDKVFFRVSVLFAEREGGSSWMKPVVLGQVILMTCLAEKRFGSALERVASFFR